MYFIAAPAPWRELLERGRADVVSRYTTALAEGPLKECCRRDPSHAGPHDVIPLAA